MKPTQLLYLVVVALVPLGCAHPDARFADRGVLWHDPDDAPVPVPPMQPELGTTRIWPGADNVIFRPTERMLTGDYFLEAVNTNSLDEVPDSSWYEDPRRDPADPAAPPRALPTAAIERGSPDEPPRAPFRIVKTLNGGSASGFVVLDALGRRYALKLDPYGHIGIVTGSDAVTTRLAGASGWRVPFDEIIEFARADLTLAPDAIMLNQWGHKEPLEDGDVEQVLRSAARLPDGRWRAVASRWVPGKVLGPFVLLGRNHDDANDRYRHENRRDLRGFGVWASWVDDVDLFENNTLDSYVGEPGRGHVVHYQLDVGGSFGTFAAEQADFWVGDQTYFKLGRILGSLFSFGAVPFYWESARWQTQRRGIVELFPEFGGFSGTHFEPRRWRPITDSPAFVRQTPRDRYWGAKRVAAFSADEIRAAVAAGHYRPEAADYLSRTLWQRRERIARAYFADVAALDSFRVERERLCFTDWWLRAGLGGGSATDYRARERGQVVDSQRGSDGSDRTCLTLPPGDGYRIIELAAQRPGERRFGPKMQVHLLGQKGTTRVLGVIR